MVGASPYLTVAGRVETGELVAHERFEVLNDNAGVWKCRTTFNCTDACPRGIEVTKAISDVKRVLNSGVI